MGVLAFNSSEFNSWNDLKQSLNKRRKRLYFKPREIWWCSIGKNIGDEQDGKNKFFERPVLIVKKCNNHLFWGLSMTSKVREGNYYVSCIVNRKVSTVILSQLRLYDSMRLQRKLGYLAEHDFINIKSELRDLLA